jgi:enolase
VRHGRLGGNVVYAIQTVFLRAAAREKKKELWEFIIGDVSKFKLPMPVGNCIGGGLHSKKIKGKRPDFQEFLLIPKEDSFSRAVTVNLRAYEFAKKLLRTRKRNDENAWMTAKNNEEVFEVLSEVAKRYNLRIGCDFAASTFFEKGYYNYKNKELIRDRVDQVDYIERLVKKYNLFYAEDSMNEEDFSGFKQINNSVGNKCMIVGDDLTTTNLGILKRAFRSGSINAIIIKPNQIGDILEVKRVVEFCKKNKIKMIFSHRSGETMDDAIADYCVGFGGDFIKTGIYGRERLIKLKRIIDIERSVKKNG